MEKSRPKNGPQKVTVLKYMPPYFRGIHGQVAYSIFCQLFVNYVPQSDGFGGAVYKSCLEKIYYCSYWMRAIVSLPIHTSQYNNIYFPLPCRLGDFVVYIYYCYSCYPNLASGIIISNTWRFILSGLSSINKAISSKQFHLVYLLQNYHIKKYESRNRIIFPPCPRE